MTPVIPHFETRFLASGGVAAQIHHQSVERKAFLNVAPQEEREFIHLPDPAFNPTEGNGRSDLSQVRIDIGILQRTGSPYR